MTSVMYKFWKPLLAAFLVISSCSKDPAQPEGAIERIVVSTTDPKGIAQTSAVSGGTINEEGSKTINARGVCWSTRANPTINDPRTRDGSGAGTFESVLKDLSPGTTYYIRAYATNETSTLYGDEKQFTTPAVALSKISTTAITDIGLFSATCGGSISDAGGGKITERGICWNTAPNPTTENKKATSGDGAGAFSTKLTGLLPGTTYYVRAYAINEAGTQYGNQQEFKTLSLTLGAVATSNVTGINTNSANCGGNVTSDGGGTVSARGLCWSTSANPTINDSRSTDGAGLGTYNTRLTGLAAGTTYFVRAYVTNEVGTAYGNQVQFTTENEKGNGGGPGGPGNGGGGGNDNGGSVASIQVTTTAISKIEKNSARTGGVIVAPNPFLFVLERGVCWSTSENPTIRDSRTRNGSGPGNFNSDLKGLNPATRYYVRAYASTLLQTYYGNQLEFQTSVGGGNGNGNGNGDEN